MSFTDEQTVELAKPLDRATVKTREQGGRKLSYIEGWHAIAEANRIFGFGGWSRETIEIKCVTEGPRTMKSGAGHGVSYIAKVRVNVGGIIREGCGTGHGIDRDLGQAHESALKEAETDAMKRALMTFGNPFGLALYDKTQAEVADMPAAAPRRPASKPTDPLIMQAGIICNEKPFWKFLAVDNADNAAQIVRDRCKIKSRAELATDVSAQKIWRALVADYRAWQRGPAIVDTSHVASPVRDATVQPPVAKTLPCAEATGGEATPPTAADYTAMWDSVILGATPKQRAKIHKMWNEQKAIRDKMEWTWEHPFKALKDRVVAALEELKKP